MKEGILILGLGVLAVAALGWYLLPAPVRNVFRPNVVVSSDPAAAPKPAEPEKKPKVLKKTLIAKEVAVMNATPANVGENDRIAAPKPVVLETVALIPPPFPTGAAILLGEDENHVVREFGTPSLRAATTFRGHDFQTLVYKRERSQANIRLEDGRVSSVYVH